MRSRPTGTEARMVSLYWRNPLQFEGAGSAGNTSCGSDRTDVAVTKTTTLTTMRPLLLDMNPATALAERRIRSTTNLHRPYVAKSLNHSEPARGPTSRPRLEIESHSSVDPELSAVHQQPQKSQSPQLFPTSKTASDALIVSESSKLTRRTQSTRGRTSLGRQGVSPEVLH